MSGATAPAEVAVHVRPARGGLWHVYIDGSRQAASEHRTATDAERSAVAVAAQFERAAIVLHDAYHRCRTLDHGQLAAQRTAL